jgi:hypothetical protein
MQTPKIKIKKKLKYVESWVEQEERNDSIIYRMMWVLIRLRNVTIVG